MANIKASVSTTNSSISAAVNPSATVIPSRVTINPNTDNPNTTGSMTHNGSATITGALSVGSLTGNVIGNVTGNLIGTPTAPTASAGTNTTQIATTEFVQSAVQGEDTIAEMNDVTLTSLTDGELLVSSSGNFINQTLAEAGINAITLTTAAQPNITSVGTLTSATISGDLGVADKIKHSSSTDTNTSIRFPTDDTFTIETAGAERFRVDSNGRIGINKTPGRTLDMDGHFRLQVSRPNRTTESVAVIRSDDQTAADLRVDGPIRVTHDLFKESGVTGGFADNSNHFHTVQTINRITQQGTGEIKNIERVQEQYYAIQDNNLKNNKAAFWNWHRVSRSIDITSVSLTNLSGWDVSAIQDSSNRQATSQAFFKDSENTIFTFSSQANREAVLSNGDLLQVNIDIDFPGAIVAASLFAKVTGVSGATANVKLYGGNYKSTNEVADGNSQTALTTNFSVNKIDTTSYLPLASSSGVDALIDNTRTTTTDTFTLNFANPHLLELNDTITIITDSTNGFKAAEVAFVKEKISSHHAKFVYGRVFEPASNLVLGDLAASSVIGVLRGSIDPLHDFTAGDQLMHFNADKLGRYKSYQIGPGSEVGGDCIAIGKNVYNNQASTIKIGYDNNMLNIHSTGIDVAGKIKTTGINNGTTHATANPITYDAKEHRFRDFDSAPNNLMVIKKTDGVPIGKVGINHNNPVSALHIVGGSTSGGGIPNEALRVVGSGLFSSKDDIALVVARDTDNNDLHGSGNALGGHVLKIKQDVSTSNTAAMEEMNIGFVGSGGGGIYTNSEANAAYLHVANGKNFEIATGSGSTPTRRLSIVGTTGTVVVDGHLSASTFSCGSITGSLRTADNLIGLNNGLTSANVNDSGIIIERGTAVDNAIMMWDESADKFVLGTTAAVSTNAGNLTVAPGDLEIKDLTASGNVAITGNLTISGTTTTINTTNLDITDNIIGLNNGLTGTNLNDSGIIIERGTSGANAAIIWDETNAKFILGTTATATADSTGNITVTEGTLKINQLETSSHITLSNGDVRLGEDGDSILFKGVSDANYRRALYAGNDNHFVTNRHTDGHLILMSNNGVAGGETERLRFKSGSGTQDAYFSNVKLGIGLSTPSNALHIRDTNEGALVRQIRIQNESIAGGTGSGIIFTNSTSETYVNATIDSIRIGGDASGSLVFSTRVDANASDVVARMTINHTGEVGIGKVATAGVELDVNGDIAASGNCTFSGTENSTSTSTGAVRITNGGLGVAGNLNVGVYSSTYSTHALTVNATTDAITMTGNLTAYGALSVQNSITGGSNASLGGSLEVGNSATIGDTVTAKGYSLTSTSFTTISTSSTLASSTNGLTVILQNTGPITITLPTLTAGHVTTFITETINAVSFVNDTGVTVNSFNGANTTAGQFAQCQVIYKTSTVAFLGGNIV